jgi:hypothetical protein
MRDRCDPLEGPRLFAMSSNRFAAANSGLLDLVMARGSGAMWLVTGWLPRADASGAARFTGSQPVVSG